MRASRFFSMVLVVAIASQVKAQNLGTPGSFVPSEVSHFSLGDSDMTVTSTSGVFEAVTAAQLTRSMDLRTGKELFIVTLVKGSDVVDTIVFVIRDSAPSECGGEVLKATPAQRLASKYVLTVTDPSTNCQTDKTNATIESSFGVTGMIDGSIQMEGTLASPF